MRVRIGFLSISQLSLFYHRPTNISHIKSKSLSSNELSQKTRCQSVPIAALCLYNIQREFKNFLCSILRDFLKIRFSRCMLYRHNAAIGTDWKLVFRNNSLYLCVCRILFNNNNKCLIYNAFLKNIPNHRNGEISCLGTF